MKTIIIDLLKTRKQKLLLIIQFFADNNLIIISADNIYYIKESNHQNKMSIKQDQVQQERNFSLADEKSKSFEKALSEVMQQPNNFLETDPADMRISLRQRDEQREREI